MEAELVTIGNELLLGFTIDTNAAHLSRALASVGAVVVRRSTVPDTAEAIRSAVREALDRTGFVITTGGLGPTRDDITKKAVAEIFDAPLELHEAYLAKLEERFEALGRSPMPAANRSQAEIPRGAVALDNRWGTAPGLWLEGPPGCVVMLPGVPREMRGLTEHEVLPRLERRLATGARGVTVSRTFRTTGVPESALAVTLDAVEEELGPATLAYLPSVEGVDLRVTAWRRPPEEADEILDAAAAVLRPRLGTACYAEGDRDLADVVLERLRARRLTLATAESCTGGMVGGRLTAVPGASDVFLGGVIAYGNAAKTEFLDVPSKMLEAHGAVSEDVAAALCRGARSRFGADAAIAVTGVAGPGGGTPDKPVGTVWLAAAAGAAQRVTSARFPGNRDEVRRRSAQAALNLLRLLLDA